MYDPKSILQMARGAFQERVDLEMAKVIDNILDPNTDAETKADAHNRVYTGR